MEREGLEENPVGREKARLGVKNKCKKTDIGRDRELDLGRETDGERAGEEGRERDGDRDGGREGEREGERESGRQGDREGESEPALPPGFLKYRMQAPFGEVTLGGNANSTGKCKCKEALRALCANIRPGSAAPAKLPGTSGPQCPGLRANSLCRHLRGRGGAGASSRSAQRARSACEGQGPRPCLMEQKTDQQKQGRWGWRGSTSAREEVRARQGEMLRKEQWARTWA